MALNSHHWHKMYRSNPRDWTRDDLEACSNDELEALCRLLGIAYSGTKQKRIERIEHAMVVRVEIATWPDPGRDHQLLVTTANELKLHYTSGQLARLARLAGVPHYLNKYGLIVGLIGWRADCRRRGQEFDQAYKARLRELRAEARANQHHVQATMKLEF